MRAGQGRGGPGVSSVDVASDQPEQLAAGSVQEGWRDARTTAGVQALAGILLPSATVFVLLLCNDQAVLGPWVNPP